MIFRLGVILLFNTNNVFAQKKKVLKYEIQRLKNDSSMLSQKIERFKNTAVDNQILLDSRLNEIKSLKDELNHLKDELSKTQENNKLIKQKAQTIISKIKTANSLLNDSLQILKNKIESMEKSANVKLIEGTYVNSVNQKLVIRNLSDSSFAFDVLWGVMDEWECLFSVTNGKATFPPEGVDYAGGYASPQYIGKVDFIAYEGDSDFPSMKFFIKENIIEIWADMHTIGWKCQKYGASQGEDYVVFRRQ